MLVRVSGLREWMLEGDGAVASVVGLRGQRIDGSDVAVAVEGAVRVARSSPAEWPQAGLPNAAASRSATAGRSGTASNVHQYAGGRPWHRLLTSGTQTTRVSGGQMLAHTTLPRPRWRWLILDQMVYLLSADCVHSREDDAPGPPYRRPSGWAN